MGKRIFCPGCGAKIDDPERTCPSCGTALPAPQTAVGFGDLPTEADQEGTSEARADLPRAPSLAGQVDATMDSHEPVDEGEVAVPPAPPTQRLQPQEPSEPAAPRSSDAGAEQHEASSLAARRGATAPGYPGPAPESPPAPPAAPPPEAPRHAPPAVPPQGPTAPHEGPPAEALAPMPAPLAAQAEFVYGQPLQAAPPAAPPHAPAATPRADDSKPQAAGLGPADTRKGLVWRTAAGGALLTWSLLFGPTITVWVLMHVLVFAKHGRGNMHELTYLTFAVGLAGLLPAMLLLTASGSCLSGRGWPRVFAAVAAGGHLVWAGAALFAVTQIFVLHGAATWVVVACAVSAGVTVILAVAVLAGGKWVGTGAAGKRPRAVPYPAWAGPLLIVLGTLSFVRGAIGLVRVTIEALDASRFELAAVRVYDSYSVFWGEVGGWLCSMVVLVAGIALVRKARWSVGLGGAAGLLTLVVDMGVVVALYGTEDIHRHGGPLLGLVEVSFLLASGIASWVALAGALRHGFRLPCTVRHEG